MRSKTPVFKRPWAIFAATLAAAFLLFSGMNQLFPLPAKVDYSTLIKARNGEIAHAFLTPDDKWRLHTSLEEISPLLRTTIIHKEDRLFYYHLGINPLALARATVMNLFTGRRTSGASTITMQVARALERRPRTYGSKLIELFRAGQLEWAYSKAEILQLYCNLLPYGGNIEGVKSAALLYFEKDPDHLSLAEITALCVIPNRPSSLVPGKNNDAIVRERNRWLHRFAKEHVFTAGQIADALQEPLLVTRHSMPRMIPHLANRLKNAGTPEVQTAIDLGMQSKLERMVQDYSRSLQLKNIRNAAVVVIDNQSHEVVSYIGSADFTDTLDGGQVDGVNAVRQPGSTLKPLLYAMCIDEGLYRPASVISDVNINYHGYAPENYNRKLNGYVTLNYALAHSLNIPAVKSLQLLGTEKFIAALSSSGFRQIRKDHRKLGLSMILGGCGASLLELAGLYSAFANDGVYAQPLLFRNGQPVRRQRLLSTAATFMINESLSRIDRPDFPLNWQSTGHLPKIAWKTGTSYGRRDAWSIGYNKRYTVAVWTGNFSGFGIPELSGASIATPLLFRIFNTIDYDSDREWFTQPADCAMRLVCAETGMPPAEHCQHTLADYFIPMVSPAAACNNIEEVLQSPDGRVSYCRNCLPQTGYQRKLYKVVPPDMQAYFDENHIAYQRIPPHNPACERIFSAGKPAILSPDNGMDYIINRRDPEPLQLQCQTGSDVSRVYWYVDDRFYKSSDAWTPQFFLPPEGQLKVSCTDDKGRNRDVWINVKYVDL